MLLGLLSTGIGYLLGSTPSAYIMGRLRRGVDIREVGGGNMGAANVFREIGIWEGIVVWLADMAKGAGAIAIARALDVSELWLLGSGFSALVGHNFPVFLGFRGGRGSATTMGILLVLAPKEMGIALGIMAIPLFTTRVVAFAIGVGFVSVPLLIWLFGGPVVLVFYSMALPIFIGLTCLLAARQGRI